MAKIQAGQHKIILDGAEMTTFEMGCLITLFLSWTGGLVAIAGFFIKKWMTSIENKHKESVIAVSSVAENTAQAVAQVARDTAAAVAIVARDTAIAVAQVAREAREEVYRMTTEIKDDIKTNRAEYTRTGAEIKGSVDNLAVLQREANGRTGKIEGAVKEVSARCEERSRAFYKG